MRESMKNNGQTRLVRRCRLRIFLGAAALILGVAAPTAALASSAGASPILYLEPESRSFMTSFYYGTGLGLIIAGVLLILRNRSCLKDPERRRQQEIREFDERSQAIGTKSWAYAGYSLFILLYVMILLSGFVSVLMVKLLLCIMAAFAGLLIIWRMILSRRM